MRCRLAGRWSGSGGIHPLVVGFAGAAAELFPIPDREGIEFWAEDFLIDHQRQAL
jgi:hypothetical protein